LMRLLETRWIRYHVLEWFCTAKKFSIQQLILNRVFCISVMQISASLFSSSIRYVARPDIQRALTKTKEAFKNVFLATRRRYFAKRA
jgi:hypothetical protein